MTTSPYGAHGVPADELARVNTFAPDLTEMQARRVRREVAAIDVSLRPTWAMGHRSVMFWGVLGFMLVEGSTLAIFVFSFFYIRRNYDQWPPPRFDPPSLLVGTVSLAVLLASMIPMWFIDRASRRENLPTLRVWKVVGLLLGIVVIVLRAVELNNLHVRWDDNAYGSAVWGLIATHGTLLAVDVVEAFVETALVFIGPFERRHFSDMSDSAIYWYFSVLTWIPLYVLVYLYPYWS